MRRVYMMHFLRQATSPALRLGILGGSILVLTQIVSIKDVVVNALGTSGLKGFADFLYSAVMTTEYSVLVLSALVVGLTVWLVSDQVQKALHMGFWDDKALYGQTQESVIRN